VQKLSFLLVLLPLVAVAQLTPNSVTVTASRSTTPQPDVARFSVSITSGVDATREDALAAASGAGLTAANFTGVSYFSSRDPLPVTWSFSTTAPLANLKSTIGLLTAVQNSLAKDKKFALSFLVSGSEVSPQAQGCAIADLVADARTQAAKLASAAGMSLGGVQAMSGGTTGAAPTSIGIGGVLSISSPVCSITVKFSLGGF
jgi:uncharacterized protein YggE